jgi:hypothetical protein
VHMHHGPDASKYTCVKAVHATCVLCSESVQLLQHVTESADAHLTWLLYARAAERDAHTCESTIADTPPSASMFFANLGEKRGQSIMLLPAPPSLVIRCAHNAHKLRMANKQTLATPAYA